MKMSGKVVIDNSCESVVVKDGEHIVLDSSKYYLENGRSRKFSSYSYGFPSKYSSTELRNNIEECLLKEHIDNINCKWAALAISHVLWPLKRYLWIKSCLINIVMEHQPDSILVLSKRDIQFNMAVNTVCSKNNISINFGDSRLYNQTVRLHEHASYSIPKIMDPYVFYYLIINFILRKVPNRIVQVYNNIDIPRRYRLNFNRVFGITEGVIRKLIGKSSVTKKIDYKKGGLINREIWGYFSSDEVDIIDVLISNYFDVYRVSHIDKISGRISSFIKNKQISLIILDSDNVDVNRLICYSAKKVNCNVSVIPHGILLEKEYGNYFGSPFQPDMIYGWNSDSSSVLNELHWSSVPISHSIFSKQHNQYKNYRYGKANKILILLPDWVAVSSDLSDDIFTTSIFEYCEVLSELEVNYAFKQHKSGDNGMILNRISVLKKAKDMYRFDIVDYNENVPDCINNFDMVLSGSTTGIYEAIIRGIPVIGINILKSQIGALNGYYLPNIDNFSFLKDEILNYDNSKVKESYSLILQSFMSGKKIKSLL